MKDSRHPGRLKIKNTHGFTLIEVMIVMVIIAILATGVVFMFANPSARVKNQAFNMLGEFNMARAEAVNRNEDVLIYFLYDVSEECQNDVNECATAGNFDGYILCVDVDDDIDCDAADTIIKTTLLNEVVQLYDIAAANGPVVKPDGSGDDLIMDDGPDADDDNDGVAFEDSDALYYTPFGTAVIDTAPENSLDTAGYVLIYYPAEQAGDMRAAPYAIVVSPSTGSLRISRWLEAGTWSRK